MSLYTHLMALFSLVLLGLMVRAGFQWKYPSFVAYYALVVAGDGFFGYVGPWFDFNYQMCWYYNLYWVLECVEHLLKIVIALGFYWTVLADYPNLRRMLDGFFYGAILLLSVLFVVSYEPSGSLLYTISIFLGKWVFLLVAVVCTFILVVRRLTGIVLERALLFIVSGFLVFSLTQCLNFFYLEAAHPQLDGFWRYFYQLSYVWPQMLWLVATVIPKEVAVAGTEPVAGLQGELLRRMRRLDAASGEALGRLNPFRAPGEPR